MTHAPRNMLYSTLSLVAIALTGCGQPAGQPESPAAPTPIPVTVTVPGKQELTICTTNEPESLIGDAGATLLWEAVGLPTAGPDGAFGAQPRALIELPPAENGDLIRNPDGTLTATLRYRDDLTWSDGQPFSADDALLGMLAAPSPEVLNVEAVDDLTLKVTLARDGGHRQQRLRRADRPGPGAIRHDGLDARRVDDAGRQPTRRGWRPEGAHPTLPLYAGQRYPDRRITGRKL